MGVAPVRLLKLFSACLLSTLSLGQTAPPMLITKPVDETQLTVLKGNTHPLARAEFDQGAAPMDLPMNRMLLVLKRSDEQESALKSLIDSQQDKSSPNYHKWLTPEAFGKQFGPSDQDIQQVTSWLQSHAFEIAQVSKGRTIIEFSGTAAQVQEALHTSIHKYAVKGEEHWANSSDPQIPAALTPVVAGVESLNNFPRKPMYRLNGTFSRTKSTGKMKSLQPLFTIPSGGCGVQSSDCYGVGPYDFATIYNVLGAWNATPAIDGTGQTIAIVGETDINPQDLTDFRNFFGLAPLTSSQLNIIHNGPAPGILTDGEETESDLDVEWSSAVAKGATIDFVVSESTETTAGIDLSAQYIVDNNLAPVMSESYGECELGLGVAGNNFFSQLWQQAVAQGITVFISSGDTGSAGCSSQDSPSPAPSIFGLAVSGFASTPYNVAVGGTDFNDVGNYNKYWSLSNNSTTQASALSYIPETTWNQTCTNSVFGAFLGFSTNPETNCNNPQLQGDVDTVAGSGGKSACTSSDGQNPTSCSNGYAKPSWQAGSNVPQDGARDIPDVSLFAAAGFPSGSFYIICEADQVGGQNSCNPANSFTNFVGIGGTSAAAPAFAGIIALVNQQTNSRQGNANYVFYKLAANQPGVFNDVTTGTIAMPCGTGTANCTISTPGDHYGILSGYNAGTGYDLATGLGSVDVANLVNKWNTVNFNASTTTLTSLSPTTITHGQTVNVSVSVTGNSGIPTGTVTLFGGGSGSQSLDSHLLDNTGMATWTSALLTGGSYGVKAHYSGDTTYGSSDSAPFPVVVNKENSSAHIGLVTFDSNTGQINSNATSAVYGSPYLLRVNIINSAGVGCLEYPHLQSGCPSGSVALTDNGSALDAGTFTLNILGYFEDQTIQLPGGLNSVQATYAGDNSFNASLPVVDAITITPATTTIGAPNICCGATVGSSFSTSASVQTTGTGVAPTGTVSFFANGNPINGTVSYQGTSGSITNPNPSLTANFTSSASAFSAAGNYAITASYGGDSNYGSAISASQSISVKYPAPFLSMGFPGLTVAAGASVTVSATIDTNLKNAPLPTGNVAFIYWGPMSPVNGTETYASTTDANGNVVLLASMTFVPAGSVSITATYNGDANYPAAGGGGLTDITVTGSDFALIPSTSSLNVTPGGGGTVLIFIVGQSNYSGTTSFSASSCSGLPAETTCNFNPSTVVGAGYTGIGINTTAPHPLSSYQKQLRTQVLAFAAGLPFAALVLIGFPSQNRRRKGMMLFLMAILLIGLGCGGGSNTGGGGGGGGTDPGTPAGTYPITITATSGSISHTAKFTLIVQ
jgi:hypothetical protein